MQLNKIELIGFKSFAERTEFEFEPGITCLVGPNGCGKSNVVDAIKWVLGEQSAKSLRGSEMTDVLFSGSDGVKSLGYCEVTLTFSNNKGILPIEYEEVAVTRRLYRSGEGEYLINNNPCRLKDIKRLFMDTGIGVNSYSLIEQGKVDILLHSGAVERRSIFEEAAGISKYRAQKKESLSKLERVDANLVRLGDIIEEVEKQLRSVKYQAAKARRYQQYVSEIKELRISFSLCNYHSMHCEKQKLVEQTEEKNDRENGLAAELALLDSKGSELNLNLSECERSISAEKQRSAIRETNITNAEQRIQEIRALLEESEQDKARLSRRLEDLEGRLAGEKETRLKLEGESARKEAELENLNYRVEETRKQFEQMSRRLKALDEETEAGKGLLFDLLQREASLHNQIGSLSAEKKIFYRELQKNRLSAANCSEQVRMATSKREELLNNSISRNEELAGIDRALIELNEEADKIEALTKNIRNEIYAANARTESLRTRCELLKDMEREHESIRSCLAEIMAEVSGSSGQSEDAPPMLCDLIEVQPEHARAIDAALGDKARAFITRDLPQTRQLVRMLTGRNAGKGVFIPAGAAQTGPQRRRIEHPAIIDYASGCVKCPPAYQDTLAALLSETALCRNLEDAFSVLAETNEPVKIVTLDGDVVERNGALAVSAAGNREAGAGVLFRKSQLKQLETEIETLEGQTRMLSERLSEKSSQASRIETHKQTLARKKDEVREALHDLEKELDLLNQEIKSRTEELEISEVEKSVAQSEIERVEKKESELARERADLEAKQKETQAALAALRSRLEETAKEEAALQENLARLRTQCAIYEEQKRGLGRRIAEAITRIESAEKEIEDSKNAVDQLEQKCRRLRSESAAKKEMLDGLILEKESASEALSKLEGQRIQLADALRENEDAIRKTRSCHHAIEQEIQELRLKEKELSINMENLAQRIMEDYNVDLVEKHKDYQEPEEPVDWNEIEKRINELRQKIENMGAINVEAINEQESLETRLGFLTSQRDDLLKAKGSLEEAIRKINRTSKELFTTTFEAIRGHFQILFRKLFGGGKANVFLVDETDVLESGIEIIARPPGKEPRSISLLSGGEKVLTATALLFAILKAKPSPFCIMDEVDAALDESNIDRFSSVLQEFLDESQFILITHNKRTMGLADIIYGITMQTSGISKRIAVKFEDISEKDGKIVLPEKKESETMNQGAGIKEEIRNVAPES